MRVDAEIFPDINFISLMDNSLLNSIYYRVVDPLKYLFHKHIFSYSL